MSSSEEPVVTITGLDLTKDKNALEKLQQEKIWFCSATARPRLPPRVRSLSDGACMHSAGHLMTAHALPAAVGSSLWPRTRQVGDGR